jgi:hypothetical protein
MCLGIHLHIYLLYIEILILSCAKYPPINLSQREWEIYNLYRVIGHINLFQDILFMSFELKQIENFNLHEL